MQIGDLFFVCACAIAIFMIFRGFFLLYRARKLVRTARRATANVIGYTEEKGVRTGLVYRALYQFEDETGAIRTIKSKTAASWKVEEIGDSDVVLFESGASHAAKFEKEIRWSPIYSFCFGVPLLCLLAYDRLTACPWHSCI